MAREPESPLTYSSSSRHQEGVPRELDTRPYFQQVLLLHGDGKSVIVQQLLVLITVQYLTVWQCAAARALPRAARAPLLIVAWRQLFPRQGL